MAEPFKQLLAIDLVEELEVVEGVWGQLYGPQAQARSAQQGRSKNHQTPDLALVRGSISGVMVELAGVLSNPEAEGKLGRLVQAVAALQHQRMPVVAPLQRFKPPQGQVLRAITTVLAEQPDGLTIVEVHALVERRLGRRVAYSTIKADLARNTRPGGCFDRVRRGLYRCAHHQSVYAR